MDKRGGLEVMVMKKKGMGGMEDPVEAAIREVMGKLDAYDSDTIRSKFRPSSEEAREEGTPEATAMGPEDCRECKEGMCENPEHMSEEDMRAMLGEGA
jgi:hypothetical protein